MPDRLPESAELKFVETLSSGTVDIDVYVPAWARPEPTETLTMGASGGRVLKTMLETPVVVRCGLPTHPNRPVNAKHQYTGRFEDERLCRGCYRTLHEDDQARAFEHETPGTTETTN
ncbi:hypothetical protein [Streptomyces sp. NPDC056670]|uniref:hypothetical protein n=1 Tax=Streptomyces sp. NPDC056670 TaxID=3345904 RepID=UPI0036ABBDC6